MNSDIDHGLFIAGQQRRDKNYDARMIARQKHPEYSEEQLELYACCCWLLLGVRWMKYSLAH